MQAAQRTLVTIGVAARSGRGGEESRRRPMGPLALLECLLVVSPSVKSSQVKSDLVLGCWPPENIRKAAIWETSAGRTFDTSFIEEGLPTAFAPAESGRSADACDRRCTRGGHRRPRHKPQVRALNQRHARQSQGVCSLAPDSSDRQVVCTHRRSLVSVCARRLSCACICSKRSSEVVGVLRHLLRWPLPAVPPPRCASVRSTRSCLRT